MSRTDYYEGKPNLWLDDWYERMFSRGEWAADPNFANVIAEEWDSYHPYACNGCKRGSLQNLKLLQCARCRVMKYCCREHQKKDWPNHKRWCKTFAEVTMGESEEASDQSAWYKRQNSTSLKIMNRMGDMRHTNSVQVPFLQPHCRRCFRTGRTPDVDLVICKQCCGVAVCKSCFGDQECTWGNLHGGDKKECDTYLAYLCCSGMIVEFGNPLVAACDTNCTVTFKPKDWHEYFSKKGNDFDRGVEMRISTMRLMAPAICFLTDGLTMWMTIQLILGELSLLTKTKLCVHILGADSNERAYLRGIVELGRLNPQLKHLDLILVGPNLPEDEIHSYSQLTVSHEAPVHFQGSIQLIRGLYHQSMTSEAPDPDLFVAFNAGISDPSHFVDWRPTLELVQRKGIPFGITGFNFLEVSNDVKILKSSGFQEQIAPKANPFRSMRPFLDPAREETDFIFNSKAYAVLLGSTGS